MKRATDDPTIKKVLRRMQAAVKPLERAREELHAALREAQKHPDSRRHYTLAWFVADCIHSILDDASLDDVAAWVRSDSDPAAVEKHLRRAIEEDKADKGRFASRKRAA